MHKVINFRRKRRGIYPKRLKQHLTTAELSSKFMSCTNLYHRNYWQILLSVSFNPNKKAEEYAQFLGIKKSKVYRIVELYNNQGAGFTDNLKWGGRRDETSYLTFEEEKILIEKIRSRAISGHILTAKDLIFETEDKLNKKVSDDYVWDLLKRHNWKKKAPRPIHPKHNQESQDELKKNSQKYWSPSQ